MRFIHTSDWHLGMQAHFLPDEARARFAQDRFDAVRRIAQLAVQRSCQFVVVAGDVFDSNHVDPRVVERAIDALGTFTVPVFLLPGNHDPHDPASIYRRPPWTQRAPTQVTVIDAPTVYTVPGCSGVELVGVPWDSKTMLTDPVAAACAESGSASATALRVIVGHGMVDRLASGQDEPSLIRSDAMIAAIQARAADYVALGDRHSATPIDGSDGRCWYSGTPVATDYGESDPNQVLVVGLDADGCTVQRERVGAWVFAQISAELSGSDEIASLSETLDAFPDKQRTVIRLTLRGTLSLAAMAELEDLLERSERTFAQINRWARHMDLVVEPSAQDLEALDVSGYVRAALDELRGQALADDDDAVTARDALNLLYRLAR